MKKKLLATVYLAVLATQAHASNWIAVGNSGTGQIVYVDAETIKRTPNGVDAWVRHQFATVQKASWGISFDSGISRQHIDCAADTYTATSISWMLNGATQDSIPKADRADSRS